MSASFVLERGEVARPPEHVALVLGLVGRVAAVDQRTRDDCEREEGWNLGHDGEIHAGDAEQVLDRHDQVGPPAGAEPPSHDRSHTNIEIGLDVRRPFALGASTPGELGRPTPEHVDIGELEVFRELGQGCHSVVVGMVDHAEILR